MSGINRDGSAQSPHDLHWFSCFNGPLGSFLRNIKPIWTGFTWLFLKMHECNSKFNAALNALCDIDFLYSNSNAKHLSLFKYCQDTWVKLVCLYIGECLVIFCKTRLQTCWEPPRCILWFCLICVKQKCDPYPAVTQTSSLLSQTACSPLDVFNHITAVLLQTQSNCTGSWWLLVSQFTGLSWLSTAILYCTF